MYYSVILHILIAELREQHRFFLRLIFQHMYSRCIEDSSLVQSCSIWRLQVTRWPLLSCVVEMQPIQDNIAGIFLTKDNLDFYFEFVSKVSNLKVQVSWFYHGLGMFSLNWWYVTTLSGLCKCIKEPSSLSKSIDTTNGMFITS